MKPAEHSSGVAGSFSAAQFVTSYFWGVLSDRCGRKVSSSALSLSSWMFQRACPSVGVVTVHGTAPSCITPAGRAQIHRHTHS